MDIAKPNNYNTVYTGDASKGIADLPVRVGEDAELGHTITSAWKPTEEEMLKLINGGLVTLTIMGYGQPPVMLAVESTTADLFRQEPFNGVIGYAQRWCAVDGPQPDTFTFDVALDHAKARHADETCGWMKHGEPFPVTRAIGYAPPGFGMGVQALAGEITDAIRKDDREQEYAVHEGNFGPAMSALIRRIVTVYLREPAYPDHEISEADAACPILALAPAEYTYWEKRVWRRGVCDLETRGEVARAVRDSILQCGADRYEPKPEKE